MRQKRVRELRQSFKDTYGFYPAKTRWFVREERPRNWFVKIWWKLTRRQPRLTQQMMQSTWRKWKKLAKEADRAQSTDNRPRGRTGRRSKVA